MWSVLLNRFLMDATEQNYKNVYVVGDHANLCKYKPTYFKSNKYFRLTASWASKLWRNKLKNEEVAILKENSCEKNC